MDHGFRRLGQRPHSRPAIQGKVPAHIAADFGRRHREISLIRHDSGRGTGLCQKARARLRRQSLRYHRDHTGPATRGRWHRAGPCRQHSGRLGGTEGGAGDHGLPAQPQRQHGPGSADLQDLRLRRHPGHVREPIPARPRYSWHWFQDCRRYRCETWHRENRHDPGSCRVFPMR